MANQWDAAIAEAARLALALMQQKKEAKLDNKEGRIELALRKERILKLADEAWDRGDLSACADLLSGVYNIPSSSSGDGRE